MTKGLSNIPQDWTGPSHYTQYNGKKERSMRDIMSYVLARHGHDGRPRREDQRWTEDR